MEDKGMDNGADGIKTTSSYKILQTSASNMDQRYTNCVYSKFLRSLKYGNFFFRMIDNHTYYDNYKKYIAMLLARPNAQILVAVLTEDPDVVLGWCLREEKTVHYVWVDALQREQKI